MSLAFNSRTSLAELGVPTEQDILVEAGKRESLAQLPHAADLLDETVGAEAFQQA